MEFPLGAKVFAVNQKGNSASVTPALVALYMTSFEEPSVPAEMSLRNLEAAINLVKLFHLVSIKPTLVKSEESPFLDALLDRNKARVIFNLADDHPAYMSCWCTSKEFAHSGSVSEEIVMVFVSLGLINAKILTQHIMPRQGPGRPLTVSGWSDTSGGTGIRTAAYFYGEIQKQPLKYYQWRAVVVVDDTYKVGVVRDLKKPDRFMWELFFLDSDKDPIWLNDTQLADALYTARRLGVAGPSPVAPPVAETDTTSSSSLPTSTPEPASSPNPICP